MWRAAPIDPLWGLRETAAGSEESGRHQGLPPPPLPLPALGTAFWSRRFMNDWLSDVPPTDRLPPLDDSRRPPPSRAPSHDGYFDDRWDAEQRYVRNVYRRLPGNLEQPAKFRKPQDHRHKKWVPVTLGDLSTNARVPTDSEYESGRIARENQYKRKGKRSYLPPLRVHYGHPPKTRKRSQEERQPRRKRNINEIYKELYSLAKKHPRDSPKEWFKRPTEEDFIQVSKHPKFEKESFQRDKATDKTQKVITLPKIENPVSRGSLMTPQISDISLPRLAGTPPDVRQRREEQENRRKKVETAIEKALQKSVDSNRLRWPCMNIELICKTHGRNLPNYNDNAAF